MTDHMDPMTETNGKRYEVVNFTYYDPQNSLFKSSKSDRARYTIYQCCNKENCGAFMRGKCFMLNGLGGKPCPYGRRSGETGYTPRARGYYSFLRDAKEKYGEHAYKLSHLSSPCVIGEYVHIALPYLKNYVNPISEELISEALIEKGKFDIDFVVRLVKFRPRAIMGGEITSYQREDVPKFLLQLKRNFPDLYTELLVRESWVKDKVESVSYKDKHALVKTLLPSRVKLSTNVLKWDGAVLTAQGKDISFWGLSDEKIIIDPTDKTFVQILEDDSVTDDTVFRDE